MIFLLLALLLAFRSDVQGNTAGPPPNYTKELGSPEDGRFRNSTDLAGTEETYFPPLFASSHAANLLLLKSGDLICTWFSGTWEGASDVGIMFARLPKGASQWDRPRRVDHHLGESYQNPVPFEAPDGALWIFHTTQEAGQGQANARVLVTKSSDHGHTWTPPSVLFATPGAFVRQRLLVLPDGRWMLPMYVTPSRGITTGAETNFSLVKVTADEGSHWGDISIPDSNGYVQPDVFRLRNGNFVAFFRSRYADFIYQSTSADGSLWTAPHKTALPNNNSSIQVAELSDGRLVLAFNNVAALQTKKGPKAGPRKPLSVALSDDEGETWRWVRDLETGVTEGRQASGDSELAKQPGREEYSYPSIIQAADGKIYVAYTYRRFTIKVVRFEADWIKAGSTSGAYQGGG